MSETGTTEHVALAFSEAEPRSRMARYFLAMARADELSAEAAEIRARANAEIGDSETAQYWRDNCASWQREAAYWRARAKEEESRS